MKDEEIYHSRAKTRQRRRKCPKCGKYYCGCPALSREDNKTEICPECSTGEALSLHLRQKFKTLPY